MLDWAEMGVQRESKISPVMLFRTLAMGEKLGLAMGWMHAVVELRALRDHGWGRGGMGMAAMEERATLDMGDAHDVIGWDGTDDGLMGGWRGHGFRFGDERQLAVQQIGTDDRRRTTDDGRSMVGGFKVWTCFSAWPWR